MTGRKQLKTRFSKVAREVFERSPNESSSGADIENRLQNQGFKLLHKCGDEHIWLENRDKASLLLNSRDKPLLLIINWIEGLVYVYYQSNSLEVPDITKVKTIIKECGGLSYRDEIKKGLKELRFQDFSYKKKTDPQNDFWIPGDYPYKVLFWFKWLNQSYTYYVLLHIIDYTGDFKSSNPLKEFKHKLIYGNYKIDKYLDNNKKK